MRYKNRDDIDILIDDLAKYEFRADRVLEKKAKKAAATVQLTTNRPANSTASTDDDSLVGVFNHAANLLHISPYALIALILLGLAVVTFCVVFCCIRCRNTRRRKKLRPEKSFDDIPLPNFMDEEEERSGTFHYSILYKSSKKVLKIGVSHATDLTPATSSSSCSCYVTAVLVEPLEIKVKTKSGHIMKEAPKLCSDFTQVTAKVSSITISDTCNPIFNAQISLNASLELIQASWLLFEFYDYDPTGVDRKMGRLITRISEIDPKRYMEAPLMQHGMIESCVDEESIGGLCLVMRYIDQQDRGTVDFIILEARSLFIEKSLIGSSSKFKIGLVVYVEGKKKKTHFSKPQDVVSVNPYFNAQFRVTLPTKVLKKKTIVKISVYLMTPPFMFRKRIGLLKVGGESEFVHGQQHWAEIMKSPLKKVAKWHQLM